MCDVSSPKTPIGCFSYFFLAKMGFLFRNSFKNPTPPTLPKTPVKKAPPRLANGKSGSFSTRKKNPANISAKRPGWVGCHLPAEALFEMTIHEGWPTQLGRLGSQLPQIPGKDVGSGSRDACWHVDSVEFEPPKKRWFNKDGPTVEKPWGSRSWRRKGAVFLREIISAQSAYISGHGTRRKPNPLALPFAWSCHNTQCLGNVDLSASAAGVTLNLIWPPGWVGKQNAYFASLVVCCSIPEKNEWQPWKMLDVDVVDFDRLFLLHLLWKEINNNLGTGGGLVFQFLSSFPSYPDFIHEKICQQKQTAILWKMPFWILPFSFDSFAFFCSVFNDVRNWARGRGETFPYKNRGGPLLSIKIITKAQLVLKKKWRQNREGQVIFSTHQF